ncbi:hypothetical protein [Microbulbifer sp. S227A]|uniref:hypothetical protein n=1 Tax=Microbulbifer sp. S227A TaxID=3415131 RepID=UPI003C7D9C94
MWDAAKSFFENAAEIISAASQSPLGIAALIIIIISIISVIFFWKEHPYYRVFAFVCLLAGAAGIFLSSNTPSPDPSDDPIAPSRHDVSLMNISLGQSDPADIAAALGTEESNFRVRELNLTEAGISGRFQSYFGYKSINDLPGRVAVHVYARDGKAFAVSLWFDTSDTGVESSGRYCNAYRTHFENWYLSRTGKALPKFHRIETEPEEREVRDNGGVRGTRFSDLSIWDISDSFSNGYYASLRVISLYTLLESVPLKDWLDDQSIRNIGQNYYGCKVNFVLALRR